MTVSTTTTKSQYTANGVTTAFTGAFRILNQAHVAVTLTSPAGVDTAQTLATDYTVTGVGGASFTVTFNVAPANGHRVTLARNVPLTQDLDLILNDEFPSTEIESALDKLTMAAQQVAETVSRALKTSPTDTAAIPDIPPVAQRASKYLAFDASGNPIAASGTPGSTVVSAFMATLLDDATAAAGRTTLGLGSLAVASSVGTADIVANAVTATKLAREGTSGQVLTSNGAGADPSYQTIAAAASVPTGAVLDYAGYSAPAGYLLCDGAAVSRTTYSALWTALSASATVTITIASPGVVTWTAHPLQNGDPVRFSTTGALPTGLGTGITYFVVNATTNTFQVAATRGGAAINTSGSQSGTHTGIYAPNGYGDGSTTFNVPDLRGRVAAGRDNMGGSAANRLTTAGSGIAGVNLGDAGGTQTHTLTTSEMPAHTHTAGFGAGTSSPAAGCGSVGQIDTGSTGGGGAHQNTQPTLVTNKIIKT
jgi:microcystin-dependent protein